MVGQVEEISFGVDKRDPVHPVLVVVRVVLGAEVDQAGDFGGQVSRGEVQVEAVLGGAGFGDLQEHQRGGVGGAVDGGEELVAVGIDWDREDAGPEGGQSSRVGAVEGDVLKGDGHGADLSGGKLLDGPADFGSVRRFVGGEIGRASGRERDEKLYGAQVVSDEIV